MTTNSSVALGAALRHKIKRLTVVHGHQEQISHKCKLHIIIAVPWTQQQSRDGESLWVTFQPLPFFELVSYRQSSYTPRAAAETTIGAPHRHTTFIIILPTNTGRRRRFIPRPSPHIQVRTSKQFKKSFYCNSRQNICDAADRKRPAIKQTINRQGPQEIITEQLLVGTRISKDDAPRQRVLDNKGCGGGSNGKIISTRNERA